MFEVKSWTDGDRKGIQVNTEKGVIRLEQEPNETDVKILYWENGKDEPIHNIDVK